MNKLDILDLGDGQFVGIEVGIAPPATDIRLVSADSGDKQTIAFDEAIARIKPMANQLVGALKDLAESPKSVEVRFGLKLSAAAGIIVAKAATEANFEVKLTWERSAPPNDK